jgi:hypothetical protein
VVLDATAGNRMMWKCKNPPHTIFLDKEKNLAIPPDIIADNRKLPFRDNVFECVLFDPPHSFKRGYGSLFNEDPKRMKGFPWYGSFRNKIDLLSSIHKAQKEFSRVAKRLCFKWNDHDMDIWKLYPFFDDWAIKYELKYRSRGHRGKRITTWATFDNKSLIL